MNIVLFGSNGQLGHALYVSLQSIANIICINSSDLDLINLSIKDVINYLSIIQNKYKTIDLVINASAYTAVDSAENDVEACKSVNTLAVEQMAIFCEIKSIPLIHYSTDYVFDGTQDIYTETSKPNPLNIYGKTKLAGEIAIQNTCSRYLIFRTSWVYSLRRANFLLTMLRISKNNNIINVVSDQYGIPTWTQTIATSTMNILLQYIFKYKGKDKDSKDKAYFWNEYSGIYNLVSSGSTSWANFASEIFKHYSVEKNESITQINKITTAQYPTQAVRPASTILSNQKIMQAFDLYLPQWNDAVKDCLSSINIKSLS
jgi:dTDP-4-dehydrorhamnose reductase